jgi:cubilin
MTTTLNLFFSWDSLTIYDGGSSSSPMMGKYCGTSIPPSQVSSSNEVFIHFHSDWSATKSGFEMEYNL